MNNDLIWELLSLRKQVHEMVSYVEWAVFKATLSDIVVDSRSLRAVVDARRVANGAIESTDVEETIGAAYGAFYGYGGYNKMNRVRALTECTVAGLRLTLIEDVGFATEKDRLGRFEKRFERKYMTDYVKQIGDTESRFAKLVGD